MAVRIPILPILLFTLGPVLWLLRRSKWSTRVQLIILAGWTFVGFLVLFFFDRRT